MSVRMGNLGRRGRALLATVLLLSVLAGDVSAGGPQQKKGPTTDRLVAEQLQTAAGGESLSVIVTAHPGAKGRVLRRLKQLGATLGEDFSIIDAASTTLSGDALRALADDPDVMSISTDAPVAASGLSAAVSGAALGTAYSLRRTLGLESSAGTVVRVASKYVRSASACSGVGFRFETPQADNRLLLAGVTFLDMTGARTVRSVTYGTQSATFVAGARDPSSMIRTEIWALVAPAVSTTNTVMASFTANVDAIVLGAAIYAGASQTSPVGPASIGSGFGTQAEVSVTSSPEQMVFSTLGMNAGVAVTSTTAAASLWMTTDALLKVRGVGADVAGGSPFRFAWTATEPREWAAVAVPINVGGPATPLSGSGVTVAVVDSGLLLDGGGTARIKTTRDFTGGSRSPKATTPLDPYGHGTHVAGLIGGDRLGAVGVAPGVSYVSLRVLDGFGAGLTSNVIKAIQWAVANRAAYGIDVLNLSLGHPIYESAETDPLVQAVEAAVRAGIVVVVSAGNIGMNPQTGRAGYGGITSPGNAPSAITVGAVRTHDTTRRTDDAVAEYSSRGPTWFDAFAKPDLVAPGHRLRGPATSTQALYKAFPDLRTSIGDRAYLHLSGTSMAAGVVSGAVALVLEGGRVRSGSTPPPNAVKAVLQHTAFLMTDAAGSLCDVLTQGAGVLNAAGAADLALATDFTAPVGSPWLAIGVAESTMVDGQTISWGQNIVWGENIVWGNAAYTNQKAWATNIVWGDNIVWADSLKPLTSVTNIVWADNIVWGNNIVWGEAYNIVWGDNIVWANLQGNPAYASSLIWLGSK